MLSQQRVLAFFNRLLKSILLEEMMMNKLIIVVLAFAIVAPALADDSSPAAFRGDEGSTFSSWTYDDPEGVYEYFADYADNSWFVSHPEKLDPEPLDPCLPHARGESTMQWVPGI
jgi:hypothetical protein